MGSGHSGQGERGVRTHITSTGEKGWGKDNEVLDVQAREWGSAEPPTTIRGSGVQQEGSRTRNAWEQGLTRPGSCGLRLVQSRYPQVAHLPLLPSLSSTDSPQRMTLTSETTPKASPTFFNKPRPRFCRTGSSMYVGAHPAGTFMSTHSVSCHNAVVTLLWITYRMDMIAGFLILLSHCFMVQLSLISCHGKMSLPCHVSHKAWNKTTVICVGHARSHLRQRRKAKEEVRFCSKNRERYLGGQLLKTPRWGPYKDPLFVVQRLCTPNVCQGLDPLCCNSDVHVLIHCLSLGTSIRSNLCDAWARNLGMGPHDENRTCLPGW